MSRIVHFEIPVEDPERVSRFYTDVFGWQFQKWAGPTDYWLITTGPADQPGINGGLLKRRDPGQPMVNTIQMPSIDQAISAIEQHGGTIVVPKMAVPGVGWLAYFKDPEANIFGVMEADTSAK
jgi:uncharacterized protein